MLHNEFWSSSNLSGARKSLTYDQSHVLNKKPRLLRELFVVVFELSVLDVRESERRAREMQERESAKRECVKARERERERERETH
jgi:hypothetical protein